MNRMVSSESKFILNHIFVKAKYSFYSAVVFFLFANPETYRILQQVFGGFVTFIYSNGMPTISGVFINTILFFITMLALMFIPNI
jgi:hypothetical protein